MTKEERIYFAAATLMAGIVQRIGLQNTDSDRKSWNKYCIEKAAAMYDEIEKKYSIKNILTKEHAERTCNREKHPQMVGQL